MLKYLVRRVLIMIPTLLVTSALIFTVMNLSPTDYFSNLVSEMQAQGEKVDTARIEFMKKEYGFDKPAVERYFLWVGGFLHGDFGYSFEYQMPVNKVVGDRVFLTILLSFATIVFTWLVAFPIGIYSATHQYSWADYGLTTIGLLGLAIPHFLLALIFLYFANTWFGLSIGGLMDPKYFDQPFSWANLLEELHKQYVVTARAKGLHPMKVLFKYPFRMSLNFFISDIGSVLPSVISGGELVAIVLSLQTTGPLLIRALQNQDIYLAGSFLLLLATLTTIGVLVSDVALALLDPRIRMQGGATK